MVGLQVTLTGINFGSTQGTSTVKLNGVTCSVVNWSNSSITAIVPSGATSGPFTVTVGGQSAMSPTLTVTQIPTGWQDRDIGAVGVAGSASFANGTFTVNGAGSGTLGTTIDGLNFVYQPLSGDGSIVARVLTANGSGTQEAGVMTRETLNAGASNAHMLYFPGQANNFNLDQRTSTGITALSRNIRASPPSSK